LQAAYINQMEINIYQMYAIKIALSKEEVFTFYSKELLDFITQKGHEFLMKILCYKIDRVDNRFKVTYYDELHKELLSYYTPPTPTYYHMQIMDDFQSVLKAQKAIKRFYKKQFQKQ
jgi:ribosome biogenesis GTPase A